MTSEQPPTVPSEGIAVDYSPTHDYNSTHGRSRPERIVHQGSMQPVFCDAEAGSGNAPGVLRPAPFAVLWKGEHNHTEEEERVYG